MIGVSGARHTVSAAHLSAEPPRSTLIHEKLSGKSVEDGSREPGEGSSRKPAQAFAGVRQGKERGRGGQRKRRGKERGPGRTPNKLPWSVWE